MPVRDYFDADRGVLLLTLEGEVSDEDLLKYARRAAGDESLPPGHDILVDARSAIPGGALQGQTLRRVADIFGREDRSPEETRVALVASNDVAYGLSRMYQAFRSESPIQLRVFREMDEARVWLGVPAD